MANKSLADWLAWQESINPKEIDLGLDRIRQKLDVRVPKLLQHISESS